MKAISTPDMAVKDQDDMSHSLILPAQWFARKLIAQ
jgi:hypothetical protein